ncbi:hypothetical protein [Lebetimonas sp. JS032]|uniref:hypothetical protein n=1 Tax=Lebetimonas sp. JS032 TaxID=990070 RepID=UPI0004637C8D|nr:hypothetical protein [Lebetimonas sp. JS032]
MNLQKMKKLILLYTFTLFKEMENIMYKRAGEDFNITIKAVDENNNSINSGTVDNVKGVKDYKFL